MTDQPSTTAHADDGHQDENRLIAERRSKLATLRANGIAFPNDFRRADFAGDLQSRYADVETWTAETLEAEGARV
ncbi:MAG TPA: lysine--tRNA ligase, partial [Lysobacter sp.]|nr:lysine--tRNA ligase [Lysobacter sp.]